MAKTEWISDVQEPAAKGREAFWAGRPIWANPLVGAAAQAWKAGWNEGLAELAGRAGDCAATTSVGERRRLLKRHRPEDIPRPFGQQPGR